MPKLKKRTITCEGCSGRGYVIDTGGDNEDISQVPCEVCNGKGEVVPIEIKILKTGGRE